MSDPALPIRPAASVILWRNGRAGHEVLMGQRGAKAAFMPSKFVFPGGGVEGEDQSDDDGLGDDCHARLAALCPSDAPTPRALIGAAKRELREETGLVLRPSAVLRFVFRAITPPGRSRRFDARFFLVSASDAVEQPDDFSDASDELDHLQWIDLTDARKLDLPFITEVVIAEVAALLAGKDQPGVPFFDNSGSTPVFRRIV